jgi:hypothetical protein
MLILLGAAFGGGVGVCGRPAQAKEYAEKMLGHKLITKQTGEGGRVCNAVSSWWLGRFAENGVVVGS